MSSKVESDSLEGGSRPAGWSYHETAPSILRADEPTLARSFGLVGLMLVTLGFAALFAEAMHYSSLIGPSLATFFCVVGVACLLFHAARDSNPEICRSYGVAAYLLLAIGIVASAIPIKGAVGTYFLPWGLVFLTLALLFLLPFLRNETSPSWRQPAIVVLGLGGTALTATGFIGGSINENFLLPYGLLLTLLGLAYAWAFAGVNGASTRAGYGAGVALTLVGGLFFLIALGRSWLPSLLYYRLHWISQRPEPYLVPSGLILMVAALLFLMVGVGLCVENRLVVMARRELAAFFYSPIAYIVLFCLAIVGWWLYANFVYEILRTPPPGGLSQPQVWPEPIIRFYIWPVIILICLVFTVPVLTMRLLSEEQRTGTLEVLLTAPVHETSVVLSKFFAAWVFFMLAWSPWGLFLISMWVLGGQPFEYRPLLIFYIDLACAGAGFLAMGLFLSSLTRNQIAAAVLGFAGMMGFTLVTIAKAMLEQRVPNSPWVTVLDHASYYDLFYNGLRDGKLAPQHLLFHLSAAVFWLFLTVKVMESRKWR